MKQQIFISSVQKELASERRAIRDFIRDDALFSQYFDVFLFEDLPAADRRADETYLDEVSASAIYLGILANEYGSTDDKGISPTEYEFGRATEDSIYRINALAHRDYQSDASAQVYVFADRVAVWNPGELPPTLTPAKLKQAHSSVPRNKRLCEALFLADYIDKAGTGILDVLAKCREAGLPEPDFVQDGDQFTVTLWRDWLTDKQLAQFELNKRQTAAIGHLKSHGTITNSEYQSLFKVAKRTASQDLNQLLSLIW